jgi:uncharacterized protein (DUF1015 family)
LPKIRPFRALRYRLDTTDLTAVTAPPYDVIDPALQARLLARHPANVVRLDLPPAMPDDEPDDRYRRAARTLSNWRATGVLATDPRPAIYVYEQAYRVPGTDAERCVRGFFGRLAVEPFGPASGVRRHERTMSGPKEDRYRLLRATSVNTSPVVGLYADASGRAAGILAAVAAGSPVSEALDDDGVRHRLWVVPVGAGDDSSPGATGDGAAELIRIASAQPVTIADGHHRYETALRYRDERLAGHAVDDDPAWAYVLMLFLDAASEPLTVLPTHRIARRLGDAGVASLLDGLREHASAEIVSREALAAWPAASAPAGGSPGGLFGLWTRSGGRIVTLAPGSFEGRTGIAPRAVDRLDVSRLGNLLESLCGIDAEAIAAGGRVAYTHDAEDALTQVDRAVDAADAAFLLEPTPAAAVIEVAADGDVMPQKSTFFYPKALTGLVISAHEW